MEIVLPQFGLFFWTALIFLAVFFILRRFAWRPILAGLQTREASIADALAQAEKAREQLQELTHQNEQLLQQARTERAEMLADAGRMRERILAEAKEKAAQEYARKVQESEQAINTARQAALTDIRNLAGQLALQVAEKLLRHELQNPAEQQRLVQQALTEINLS